MKRNFNYFIAIILLLVTMVSIFISCNKEQEIDPLSQKEEITIACISDLHSRDNNLLNQKLRGTVIDTLNGLKEEDVDILVMGGDLASGTIINETKNNVLLNKFNDLAKQVTPRILYLTGNHDYSTAHNIYPSSWMKSTDNLFYQYNSADYFNKFMKDNNSLSKPINIYSEYYDNRDHQNAAQCEYILGYHYKLGGIHFIGLNTHPGDLAGDKQRYNYSLTDGTINFALEELRKIEKTERVFLLCHYPLNDSKNLRKDKGLLEELSNQFKDSLLEYDNLIYLYGHDHKNGVDREGNNTNCFIKENTNERITQYYKDNGEKSFISCFMGSMSYENTPGDPDTSKEDPTIAQSLIIKVSKNKISLQMKNYGVNHGGKLDIEKYVIEI